MGLVVVWCGMLSHVFYSIITFAGDNLVMSWLFIEFATLSLFPMFFVFSVTLNVYSALFFFYVVSAVASVLVLFGVLSEGFWLLTFVGFSIKFGIFPFVYWVYHVVLNSNWYVVWGISTFLKSPVFLFPFLFGLGDWLWFEVILFAMFGLLAIYFWLFSYNWFGCWAHMMLASTAVLVLLSLVSPISIVFYLFVVYVLWASLVIWFFSWCGSEFSSCLSLGGWFVYCILLVATPFSFSLFYKLVSVFCVCAFPLFVIVSWVVYSISEQVYLVSWAVNNNFPRGSSGFSNYV
uniref:NADH dehydrogenase subunit 2 n=1 Tax=Dicrocoelium chinensis TaxID=483157 RepID=A0A096XCB8_DICCN|nr:NADH dehydrogenase subunit 2 [Dicrocoelium chinensis]AHG06501.1 NADH dehydrogenase subunit 2 [Dicrocoelium chinensis]